MNFRTAASIAGACAIVLAGTHGTTYAADPKSAPALTVDSATRDFNIPAQSLSGALIAFGEQSGVQFSMGSDLVGGKTSPGLTGRYRVDEALKILLSGSGLSYRYTGRDAIAIEKAPATGTRTLGPVRVQGAETRTVAANGSTDPTATEGTGSYTASALTIGGKTPHTLKETPQSVTVVTQQRIADQNLTNLAEVLTQSTGITLVQGSGTGELGGSLYSRGFPVNSYQLDGGAPMRLDGAGTRHFQPNLAQYDHVELLRGADGLYSGDGYPGGVVNLVRKRPLDHGQFLVTAQAGRWNDYRAETDASGPLALEGRLRARLVTSYEDKNYYYDVVRNSKTFLYGITELDVTPATVFSTGMSFERVNREGFSGYGLPRYEAGDDLGLPRSACFCTLWGTWNSQTAEIFARVEQQLGERWAAKLNIARTRESSDNKGSYNYGPVNRETLLGHDFTSGGHTYTFNKQWLADASLNGTFTLFGRQHELTLGANWSNDEGTLANYFFTAANTPLPPIDVFHFDPTLYPEPSSDSLALSGYPDMGEQRWGAYVNLRLQILEPLHFVIGTRYSYFERTSIYASYDIAGNVTTADRSYFKETAIGAPKMALTYDLTPQWTLFTSYARTDSPQANLYTGPFPGSEPLEVVRGANLEVGAKTALLDGALNGSLVAYRIQRDHEGQLDPAYPWSPEVPSLTEGRSCCYQAVGEVVSEGFEAELTGEIRPHWQISAGYTFNQNEYKSGFESLNGQAYHSQTPKHLFKLWTVAQLPGVAARWKVGGGVTAQSANFKSGTICLENASYTVGDKQYFYCTVSAPYAFTIGSWAVVDAHAEYQLGTSWVASLNVSNVLDRTYYQTVNDTAGGNWYGEPRNWTLTLRGRF